MPYTWEDFTREHLHLLAPKERLEGISVKERFEGISIKKIE